MQVEDDVKSALSLLNNATLLTNENYKKLLENCFSVLITKQEPHNLPALLGSKPDVIKQLYAALLKISLEFARHDVSADSATNMLKTDCNMESARAETYIEYYNKNKIKLQIILGNIGTHLPHIVDVKWKIDYIIKTSHLDQFEGPIFRIVLITESYDETTCDKKQNEIAFSCDSRELQDLVYKLKDAVRHCQKMSIEH